MQSRTKSVSIAWSSIAVCAIGVVLAVRVAFADADIDENADAPVAEYRLIVAPDQLRYRFDQPVYLKITFENASRDEVRVLSTEMMQVYRFDVRLPNGDSAPLTLWGKHRSMGFPVGLRLRTVVPGDTDTNRVLLSRVFDMTLLGEYTVTVRRRALLPGADTEEDIEWVDVVSDPVTIVIHEDAKPEEPVSRSGPARTTFCGTHVVSGQARTYAVTPHRVHPARFARSPRSQPRVR